MQNLGSSYIPITAITGSTSVWLCTFMCPHVVFITRLMGERFVAPKNRVKKQEDV